MKILVTGGAGYIGSHTCYALLKSGYDVIVFDSFTNSSPESLIRVKEILGKEKINYENFHAFKGDIRNEKDLLNVFSKELSTGKEIDAVIHFAGLKSVKESVEQPIKYWDFNVGGTINLLKVMKSFNCHSIVFSSSATIYNSTNYCKFKESSELNPISPYGMTKVIVENFLEDIKKNSIQNWRIANLRYFNPIGSHESGLIGENPLSSPNNLFPIINLVAKGIQKELKIYGNDWPTNDGTTLRDYIHVMDLAEGHLSSLNYLFNNKTPNFLTVNLGTGKGTSVLELVETFMKVNKVRIPYVFTDRRSGDSCFLVADNSKALSLLDWKPKRDISQMCLDGWKWKCLNPEGYK